MPATRPGQGTSAAGRWMDGFPRKKPIFAGARAQAAGLRATVAAVVR